jgi:hypothetical protein
MSTTTFQSILNKYRQISFSERDMGDRFGNQKKCFLAHAPIDNCIFGFLIKELRIYNGKKEQ